jgi:septal ring factor EnvC (AmiA/AmiB activator)
MSDTYEINERNEVVPYTAGRRCNDTRSWRDATEMELQQRESIVQLERELTSVTDQRDRLAKEVENLRAAQIHTCHDQCQKPMCVMRRQRDRLAKALERANECLSNAEDVMHGAGSDDVSRARRVISDTLAAAKGGKDV